MTRRALVTGMSGFIGGKLARRLRADGWTVHALIRSGGSAEGGDAAHRYDGGTESVIAAVAAARPDVTFHLASLYLADHKPDDVERLVASNVLLTAQLGEAVSGAHGGRLITTGTGWQHGRGRDYLPVNLYAATKQAGADLLRYYADARELSLVELKLFDTYGPGDTRRKLVQLLVEATTRGELLGMSPGHQRIDLTHVDDVVDGFVVAADRLLAAPTPLCESYFLSGARLSVRELAAAVGAALGRPVPARFGERPYRAREIMEPAAPEPSLPGWSPRTPLIDGIRALAAATDLVA